MKLGDIRSRMLLAALLPVTLIAILLPAVFLFSHLGDITQAHSQRQRSLARQLASAAEYGLFSFNTGYLQTVASGALREADVRSVVIVDLQGHILASAGKASDTTPPPLSGHESIQFDPVRRIDLLSQPVAAGQVKLDDLFEVSPPQELNPQRLLGHVLLEFSRESLDRRVREMILIGVAVAGAGLLFAGVLALRLGRGVIRPILRVSDLIARLGAGELSARADVLPDDPLHDVQRGLNQMAERLQAGRDELEQRVVEATRELRQKMEEAETATLAKSRFLAAASHDLRQPTHAMGMFMARLAQLPHDAQSQQLIADLDASVLALQDLLDALLDISRLEARAVQVHLRPFALTEVFDQIHDELALTAVEKGLRLKIRPTGVWLMSDTTLLHRILLNLVVNALRYTVTGGAVLACRVAAGGSHARIQVWDSGIGIAREHHESIFKEFYQVANPGRDRSQGLGLGLAIVARKAQLLGYHVQICSRPGHGTRFSIDVPLVPPGAAVDRRQTLRPDALDTLAGSRILVIEDDVLAREGLVSLLTSWGARVGVADGLANASRYLKGGALPDVIVSDYRLADGENGIEVIAQIRAALGQSVPACLISGDVDPALMEAARQAALTLLQKPVRPAKLRSLIRRLVPGLQAGGPDLM